MARKGLAEEAPVKPRMRGAWGTREERGGE